MGWVKLDERPLMDLDVLTDIKPAALRIKGESDIHPELWYPAIAFGGEPRLACFDADAGRADKDAAVDDAILTLLEIGQIARDCGLSVFEPISDALDGMEGLK